MNNRLRALQDERGFTIIEVMVAIFILAVGVLGSAQLVNTANGLTLNTKQREGATNLAREIIEAARGVDYDTLTPSRALASLQAQPGLADASASTPGWQVIRRGTTYTVNSIDSNGNFVNADGKGTPCAWDDPRDGTRSTSDTSIAALLCSGLSTANPSLDTGSACGVPPVVPCIDANPDDYRRLELNVKWTHDAVTRSVNQAGIIVNPSGGLGPRTVSISPSSQTVTDPSITSQAYTVVTGTNAQSVNWAADDKGNTEGTGLLTPSSAPPSWTFSYNLGAVGASGAVLDGTYTVSVQAFDALGIPGDLKTATITLNRSAPLAPTTVTGGRDDRAGSQTELIDLTWASSAERDIQGYRVYRVGSPDVLVCDTTTFANQLQNSCTDRNQPGGTAPLSNPQYYVVALDKQPVTNNLREGAHSATFNVPSKDADPVWPAGTTLSGTTTNGVPSLTWSSAATDPNNSNGPPLFYRIYRDGGNPPSVVDRYDVTDNGNVTTYADQNPGGSTAHTYWVTAVSAHYQEGPLLGPVSTP